MIDGGLNNAKAATADTQVAGQRTLDRPRKMRLCPICAMNAVSATEKETRSADCATQFQGPPSAATHASMQLDKEPPVFATRACVWQLLAQNHEFPASDMRDKDVTENDMLSVQEELDDVSMEATILQRVATTSCAVGRHAVDLRVHIL